MNNLIPAADQTHLLLATSEKGVASYARFTVIGWQYIQGNMAFPIVALNLEGMAGRRIIEFPDGRICDVADRHEYESLEEFEEAKAFDLPDSKTPAAAPVTSAGQPLSDRIQDLKTQDEEDRDEHEDAADGEFEDPVIQTPGTGPSTNENEITRWSDIPTGKDSLTNNSFWSWPARNVIFVVEGGSPRPKHDGIEKVTRDAYTALKRTGAHVLTPTSPSGPAPSEEPAEEDDEGINDLL